MRIDDKLVFMERRVVVQVKNYATGATCGMGALHKHFRGGSLKPIHQTLEQKFTQHIFS